MRENLLLVYWGFLLFIPEWHKEVFVIINNCRNPNLVNNQYLWIITIKFIKLNPRYVVQNLILIIFSYKLTAVNKANF